MKTWNSDQVIIYDADCPMCKWYTGKFVKHGLLPEGGREAYQQAGPFTKTKIDMNKARNHIALLNKDTGEVKYGYESLVEILSARWTWIKKITTLKLVAPMIARLYDFISSNRKIIIPTTPRGFLDCIPDPNIPMRIAFLTLCMLVVEFTAGNYFFRYFGEITRANTLPFRESFLFLAQLAFQALVVVFASRKNAWDYLGNMAFVSLLGGIFLFAFQIVLSLIPSSEGNAHFLSIAGLGAVLMWMFMEHNRRIKIAGYPKILSYSWVFFRIVLYFAIFRFQG